MPNWSFNSLSISGDKDDIAKVKAQLNQPYERQFQDYSGDFKNPTIKTVKFDNPVFAFWNIVRPTDMETYLGQPDHTLPIEEQMKFKTNDWYSWNVRNWGTKWDVGASNDDEYPETDLHIDEPNHLVYSFNTAWSPPVPAVEKISQQYPNLTFDLEYQEETGWGGEIVFKAGEVVTESEYDNKCPDCDEINCLDWDDETSEEFCNKCNYRS